MNLAVVVAVALIAPVVVAALGNRNDTVALIDTVNERAPCDAPSALLTQRPG